MVWCEIRAELRCKGSSTCLFAAQHQLAPLAPAVPPTGAEQLHSEPPVCKCTAFVFAGTEQRTANEKFMLEPLVAEVRECVHVPAVCACSASWAPACAGQLGVQALSELRDWELLARSHHSRQLSTPLLQPLPSCLTACQPSRVPALDATHCCPTATCRAQVCAAPHRLNTCHPSLPLPPLPLCAVLRRPAGRILLLRGGGEQGVLH